MQGLVVFILRCMKMEGNAFLLLKLINLQDKPMSINFKLKSPEVFEKGNFNEDITDEK